MEVGDQVFFYHSNQRKEIVGVTQVIKTAYADPTIDVVRWSAVDLARSARLNLKENLN